MRVKCKVASRGSQKWLQQIVNRAPELLDRPLARELGLSATDRITWLSPKADDDHAEYRDASFLKLIDASLPRHPLSDFWPERGPQWDALGRTSRGEALLVEAKAHVRELLSDECKASGKSLRTIRASMDAVKRAIGSRADTDWCGLYYQYTNRLAHLHLLRNLNRVPAFLVFVYFYNDTEMSGPHSAEEWAGAVALMHAQLGIDRGRLKKAFGSSIVEVFIDVKDVEAATT